MNDIGEAAGIARSFDKMFADRLPDRVRKTLAWVGVGYMVYEMGRRTVELVRRSASHTVAVSSTDDIYPDIHAWLLDRMAPNRRRAVNVGTRRAHRDTPTSITDTTTGDADGGLVVFYDGTRAQTISIGGHRIRVELEKPDTDIMKWMADESYRPRRDERIVFTAYGTPARQAVLAFLAEIAATRNTSNRSPNFYLAQRYGGWDRRNDIPRRPLKSVVLRDGQADDIVADLTRFLAAEADYATLGIPYHRGYLLHGPPGSGKTSIAKALATEFDLDIYYVPLADIDRDANLMQTIGMMSPGGMLLLEDIDVFHAATTRVDDSDKPAVTLSGLLNTLDGVATPHGLVTVMTTNNLDALDSALLRPGRVDRLLEVGFMDDDQFARLVELFVGRRVTMPSLRGRRVAAADVVEVMKRHLDDRERAVEALAELVRAAA